MKRSQREIPKAQWVDVESQVVAADLCSGCGVCPVVCPVANCISIDFDRNREYRPYVDHDSCINCGICLQICPDNNQLDEKAAALFGVPDAQQNDPVLGPYVANFVGYSCSGRANGASGGVLSAILRHLLQAGLVDGVVTAVPTAASRNGVLFRAGIVTTDAELIASGGSKYYPIEHSRTLEYIDTHPGRYAVVGLPCSVTAIRKAQLRRPRLRNRIPFLFALTCGHNVSASYTEYLLKSNGIPLESVTAVNYRDKVGTRDAHDFNLAVTQQVPSGESLTKRFSFLGSNVGITWYNHLFTLNKCLYCTDLFGDLSDASFADAWLPEYLKDTRGTSMVVVRNGRVLDVIEELRRTGELTLSECSPEHMVEAQRNQVNFKRIGVAERVRIRRLFNSTFPDYGTNANHTGILRALHRQLPTLVNVLASKWLYRAGCLERLGTKRFLILLHPWTTLGRVVRKLLRVAKSAFGRRKSR